MTCLFLALYCYYYPTNIRFQVKSQQYALKSAPSEEWSSSCLNSAPTGPGLSRPVHAGWWCLGLLRSVARGCWPDSPRPTMGPEPELVRHLGFSWPQPIWMKPTLHGSELSRDYESVINFSLSCTASAPHEPQHRVLWHGLKVTFRLEKRIN